jgi:response regulator RpfG family c-di-GMP phosphodiesterase
MSGNKAILIIDDEFIILESLRIQISRILPDDVLLEAATTGEESFQLIDEFKQNQKDLVLVISDFNLDDAKGTDVLKHALSHFPAVKKAILTGQADSELIQQFDKDYGLDAIITKPWDFQEINNMITPLLRD